MAKTESTMLTLGTKFSDFTLPDFAGRTFSTKEFNQQTPILVMFICNHCPYVLHVLKNLVSIAHDLQARGVNVIAINSNDITTHPDDSPQNMAKIAKDYGFKFPYLFDETQAVAKTFQAACTPDFYLFDASHSLVYRGQLDDSRPGNTKPTDGKDLLNAVNLVLAGKTPPTMQRPSLGCNIKWKAGNAPQYYAS